RPARHLHVIVQIAPEISAFCILVVDKADGPEWERSFGDLFSRRVLIFEIDEITAPPGEQIDGIEFFQRGVGVSHDIPDLTAQHRPAAQVDIGQKKYPTDARRNGAIWANIPKQHRYGKETAGPGRARQRADHHDVDRPAKGRTAIESGYTGNRLAKLT